MSFFSALFGGSNPTLNKTMAASGQIGGFATGVGEGDTSSASNFWNTLLSGNQSQIAKLLAPQTNAIQQQASQAKKTTGEFGNRGGGTNSSMQMVGDKATGAVNDMVSNLTSSAASNLGSLGTNLIGQGLGAYNQQANMSQQQMQNWQNSIFGGLIGGVSGTLGNAASAALGKIPGLKNLI